VKHLPLTPLTLLVSLVQYLALVIFHHFAERKIKGKIGNLHTVRDWDFNFSQKA
jgi:hypothetical protein